MSATDDTENFPAADVANAPMSNGRAPHGVLTAPAAGHENGRPAGLAAAAIPPRFLTALLRALSVWPA